MPIGIYERKITSTIKEANRERMLGKKRPKKVRKKISEAHQGSKAYNWKGGRQILNGYIFILSPNHPYKNSSGRGYVAEHRLIMEAKLGRYLRKDELIHHINCNRKDNRIENLCLTSSKTHPIEERKSMYKLGWRDAYKKLLGKLPKEKEYIIPRNYKNSQMNDEIMGFNDCLSQVKQIIEEECK